MARKGLKQCTLTMPNGDRKYFYGATLQEAQEKRLQAKLAMSIGVDICNNTTVGELAQMWFNVEKKPNPNENTVMFWKDILDRNVLPSLTHYLAKDVRPMHIKSVMNAMLSRSQSEASHTLQALRGIFDFAVDNGVILKSPVPKTLKAKGKPTKKVQPLTVDQENTLLRAVEGTRAYAFVYLGLKTGLRRGELAGLQWDCIDLKERTLEVRRNLVIVRGKAVLHEYPKTEAGFRSIPLSDGTVALLKEMKRKAVSPFVITAKDGQMLNANSYSNLWKLVVARKAPTTVKMGKDGKPLPNKHPKVLRIIDFPVHPHVLRHTYATRLFERGLSVKQVQYLLGHSDPTVTMRIYIHFCEAQSLQETHEKAREAVSY